MDSTTTSTTACRSSVMPAIGALPGAASACRAFVRATLMVWGLNGDLADDVELVSNELVINSIAASTGADGRPAYRDGQMPLVGIGLRRNDASRTLRVEVWDTAEGKPELRRADDLAESGRGLAIVRELSRDWGWYPDGRSGKFTWAEFSLPGCRDA
jgi:hypothetical protein